MITDIPTGDDFAESGTSYLNLAWDAVMGLALDYEEAEEHGYAAVEEVSDDYWSAAQRHLATAVSLAQQGTEFLLKGRIAAVSPYVLISGDPSDWPGPCDKKPVPFSEFKTIDARDLLRAHDTLHATPLPDNFKQSFEKLRRYRNSVMHTIDPSLRFKAEDVLIQILEISHHLVGPAEWLNARREFLEAAPAATAWSPEHVVGRMIREAKFLYDLLEPAERNRFMGIDKGRRYICYACYLGSKDYHDERPDFAQLRPNDPVSTNLHCFLCGTDTTVLRKDCTEESCKGNVIHASEEVCLTCLKDQGETSGA